MSDLELDRALQKCRETYYGTGKCMDRTYLEARYEYHRLLIKRGLLDPKLAEPKPQYKPPLI